MAFKTFKRDDKIEPPVFTNEWMNELLGKIDPKDPVTSRISAFMVGLMAAPWAGLQSASMHWTTEEIWDDCCTKRVLVPQIDIKFDSPYH